jgi:hypothetical protein
MPVKNQSEYDSKKPPTVKKPKPSAKIKKLEAARRGEG